MIPELLLTCTLLSPQCLSLPLEEEISVRELIVVATLYRKGDDISVFSVVESYKGNTGDRFALIGDYAFARDTKYLIFADLLTQSKYQLDPCSLTMPLINAGKLTMETLENLPCYVESETIEARNKKYQEETKGLRGELTGACHRTWEPVCGCDGKTYGNFCEMRNKGIMKYRPGECK